MDRLGFNESGWVRDTVGGWRSQSSGHLSVREDIVELRYGGEMLIVDGFRCI